MQRYAQLHYGNEKKKKVTDSKDSCLYFGGIFTLEHLDKGNAAKLSNKYLDGRIQQFKKQIRNATHTNSL